MTWVTFLDVSTSEKTTTREAQRLATRERLFAAAVAEFKRTGVAGADVAAIVAEAGVAHGTFFFHFPTKEHVVAELGHREEVRMAGELDRFLRTPGIFGHAGRGRSGRRAPLERRLGTPLFKDMIALYFSPNRPELQPWTDHPLIARVIERVPARRRSGRDPRRSDVDPANGAIFFFIGLFALLITYDRRPARTALLEQYMTVLLRGLEIDESARRPPSRPVHDPSIALDERDLAPPEEAPCSTRSCASPSPGAICALVVAFWYYIMSRLGTF